MFQIDKIFNWFSLVVINIVVILLTEFSDSGVYFYQKGLIHIVAIIFVVLALFRIFKHYYTYDPFLEKFIHASLAALCIFTIVHIGEYVGMVFFYYYQDIAFLLAVNAYIIGLLLISIGAESFLKVHERRSNFISNIFWALVVFFLALSLFILFSGADISLDPDSLIPYLYVALVLVVGVISQFRMFGIKNIVGISKGFVNYLSLSVFLIILSALTYVLYDILQELLGVADYQVIYFSHFVFYIALSAMFLAFQKLSYLGGLYEQVRKADLDSRK